VVWIHHRAPESWLRYLLREDTILKDMALLDALCRRGIRFRIVTGRKIEGVQDATVLYTVHAYNPDGLANQAEGLLDALRRAEARGNTMLPSAAEAEWWENTVFMHRRFAELGIRCPATTILGPGEPVDPDAFTYPVLAKEPHSQGSAGLHKVNSPEELVALRERLVAAGEPELLVQELVDMSRDLRATCVGDEVVHHYFPSSGGIGSSRRCTSAACERVLLTFAGRATTSRPSPSSWRSVRRTPRTLRRRPPGGIGRMPTSRGSSPDPTGSRRRSST
jgi:hypothetical protein